MRLEWAGAKSCISARVKRQHPHLIGFSECRGILQQSYGSRHASRQSRQDHRPKHELVVRSRKPALEPMQLDKALLSQRERMDNLYYSCGGTDLRIPQCPCAGHHDRLKSLKGKCQQLAVGKNSVPFEQPFVIFVKVNNSGQVSLFSVLSDSSLAGNFIDRLWELFFLNTLGRSPKCSLWPFSSTN